MPRRELIKREPVCGASNKICELITRPRLAQSDRGAQSEMADWVPFHQQEALTTRLANILEEYPVGVGSLREFVQLSLIHI